MADQFPTSAQRQPTTEMNEKGELWILLASRFWQDTFDLDATTALLYFSVDELSWSDARLLAWAGKLIDPPIR